MKNEIGVQIQMLGVGIAGDTASGLSPGVAMDARLLYTKLSSTSMPRQASTARGCTSTIVRPGTVHYILDFLQSGAARLRVN